MNTKTDRMDVLVALTKGKVLVVGKNADFAGVTFRPLDHGTVRIEDPDEKVPATTDTVSATLRLAKLADAISAFGGGDDVIQLEEPSDEEIALLIEQAEFDRDHGIGVYA